MEHYRRNIDELNKMQSHHEDKDSPYEGRLRNPVFAGMFPVVLTRLFNHFRTLRRRVLVLPFNY